MEEGLTRTRMFLQDSATYPFFHDGFLHVVKVTRYMCDVRLALLWSLSSGVRERRRLEFVDLWNLWLGMDKDSLASSYIQYDIQVVGLTWIPTFTIFSLSESRT